MVLTQCSAETIPVRKDIAANISSFCDEDGSRFSFVVYPPWVSLLSFIELVTSVCCCCCFSSFDDLIFCGEESSIWISFSSLAESVVVTTSVSSEDDSTALPDVSLEVL